MEAYNCLVDWQLKWTFHFPLSLYFAYCNSGTNLPEYILNMSLESLKCLNEISVISRINTLVAPVQHLAVYGKKISAYNIGN